MRAWILNVELLDSSPDVDPRAPPSKTDGVGGSMIDLRNYIFCNFHTPQSLRDSSPVSGEQLSNLYQTLL